MNFLKKFWQHILSSSVWMWHFIRKYCFGLFPPQLLLEGWEMPWYHMSVWNDTTSWRLCVDMTSYGRHINVTLMHILVSIRTSMVLRYTHSRWRYCWECTQVVTVVSKWVTLNNHESPTSNQLHNPKLPGPRCSKVATIISRIIHALARTVKNYISWCKFTYVLFGYE